MSEESQPKSYRPGDLAPVSGVYRVTHLTGHRNPHEAVLIRGEQLPTCRTCGPNVAFEVVHALSHVTHEWDFAGPQGLMVGLIRRDSRDLRHWRRYEVELPVMISPQDRSEPASIEGTTCNLSEGGMSVTFAKMVCSPEPLNMAITIPDEDRALRVSARLRHVNGNRHGFEFVGLGREAKRKLRSTLDWLNQ